LKYLIIDLEIGYLNDEISRLKQKLENIDSLKKVNFTLSISNSMDMSVGGLSKSRKMLMNAMRDDEMNYLKIEHELLEKRGNELKEKLNMQKNINNSNGEIVEKK